MPGRISGIGVVGMVTTSFVEVLCSAVPLAVQPMEGEEPPRTNAGFANPLDGSRDGWANAVVGEGIERVASIAREAVVSFMVAVNKPQTQ